MGVLVLGTTGFVDNSIALAHVRAGHDVYGTTRITPAVASWPEGWAPLVDDMDLIVDASATLGPDASYTNIERMGG